MSKERFQRKKKENKDAETEKRFQWNQKEQYILQKAKEGSGLAQTALQALGAINTRLDGINETIGVIDNTMKNYTSTQDAEMKVLTKSNNALIDIFIDIADRLGIEISDTIAKDLGLEKVETPTEVISVKEKENGHEPEKTKQNDTPLQEPA